MSGVEQTEVLLYNSKTCEALNDLFHIDTSSKVPFNHCGPLGKLMYGFSTPKNIGPL